MMKTLYQIKTSKRWVCLNTVQSTKTLKACREKLLSEFLKEIKADGTWRNWLNNQSELYLSGVCKFLGQKEGNKTWDSSFLRSSNWGVHYKNEFNQWVYNELSGKTDGDPFEDVVNTDILSSWLNVDGLPGEVKTFVIAQVNEKRRLSETNLSLETQIESMRLELLNLHAELTGLRSAYNSIDEHYMLSIRTLTYG